MLKTRSTNAFDTHFTTQFDHIEDFLHLNHLPYCLLGKPGWFRFNELIGFRFLVDVTFGTAKPVWENVLFCFAFSRDLPDVIQADIVAKRSTL